MDNEEDRDERPAFAVNLQMPSPPTTERGRSGESLRPRVGRGLLSDRRRIGIGGRVGLGLAVRFGARTVMGLGMDLRVLRKLVRELRGRSRLHMRLRVTRR